MISFAARVDIALHSFPLKKETDEGAHFLVHSHLMTDGPPGESVLCVREDISRSLLCSTWEAERSLLNACIEDGLYFFANNERTRRTFFRVQDDVNSRAPSHVAKTGEWDYHLYFLTRKEYHRKNPYRRATKGSDDDDDALPPPAPPGLETSTVENPALEFFTTFAEAQQSITSAAHATISHNPILMAKQKLRDVLVAEKAVRRQIESLLADFMQLLRQRRDRCHKFTPLVPSPFVDIGGSDT